MNGTGVYIVAAAIIVVVVVALLSYWTMRQLRKHETPRPPRTTRSGSRAPQPAPDAAETVLEQAAEAVETGLAAAVAPSVVMERRTDDVPASQDVDGARAASAGRAQTALPEAEEWLPDHRPSLVLARAQAADGIRHVDEDQVIGLSAYGSDGSGWDEVSALRRELEAAGDGSATGGAGAKPAEDETGRADEALTGATGTADRTGASDEAGNIGRWPADDAPATADAAPARAAGPLTADDFHALLRRRLQHPAVLGWLVLSAEGQFRDGDQVYDDRVLELLTALAANARETATTVGLTAPREVVVRGAEGVICVVPANQIETGRTESVVVFVEDGGPSPREVARRLGAEDGSAVDDATTG